MEHRLLGQTGITVSALGFGTGSIGGLFVRGDPDEQRRAAARALEVGVTYFDTASMYGNGRSEENLGRVLRELGAWERVAVGTKVRLAAADLADPVAAIARSVEASLGRLGHPSVDLLQLHNSIMDMSMESVSDETARAGAVDLEAVRGEIAEGLRQVRARGLVRHVGFTGLGHTKALREAATSGPFETVQAYFNAIIPSAGYAGASGEEQDFDGLINTAASANLGVIAIRVMAAGALATEGARHPNAGEPGRALAHGAEYSHDIQRARSLEQFAREAGLESPSELAVRFALSKQGISTVLVGYSNLEQLDDTIRWAERGPLSNDLIQQVIDMAR